MGAVGLHYFYLNKPTAGIIFLVATLLSCGALGLVTEIVSIIQAVLFFTSSQEEFDRKWVNCPTNFPIF